MSKPFNIHDWQAKQRLAENDDYERRQAIYQKRQDDLTPGKNPDAFYGDDRFPGEDEAGMAPRYDDTSQESMSNADIKALQTVVGDYSLNKILNTIAVIADKIGKHDEAKMIKNLASKTQDFEDENNDRNLAQDDARDYNSEKDFLPIQEHTVNFTKDDMATLHNSGELVKADDDGKDHTYTFKGDLKEQGFDDRLANAMGMSDDEFEDQVASRDIGSRFPGEDEAGMAPRYDSNEGVLQAQDLIEELRENYKSMSDEELDSFSVEMVEHFLDNLSAQVRAKTILTTRGI